MKPEDRAASAVRHWQETDGNAHSVHRSIKGFISAAIRVAEAEEREACARLVEEMMKPGVRPEEIAAAVRGRWAE